MTVELVNNEKTTEEKKKLLDSISIIQHIKEGKTITRIELFSNNLKEYMIVPLFTTIQDGKFIIFDKMNTINVVVNNKQSNLTFSKKHKSDKQEQLSSILEYTTCYPIGAVRKFDEITVNTPIYDNIVGIVNSFYNE